MALRREVHQLTMDTGNSEFQSASTFNQGVLYKGTRSNGVIRRSARGGPGIIFECSNYSGLRWKYSVHFALILVIVMLSGYFPSENWSCLLFASGLRDISCDVTSGSMPEQNPYAFVFTEEEKRLDFVCTSSKGINFVPKKGYPDNPEVCDMYEESLDTCMYLSKPLAKILPNFNSHWTQHVDEGGKSVKFSLTLSKDEYPPVEVGFRVGCSTDDHTEFCPIDVTVLPFTPYTKDQTAYCSYTKQIQSEVSITLSPQANFVTIDCGSEDILMDPEDYPSNTCLEKPYFGDECDTRPLKDVFPGYSPDWWKKHKDGRVTLTVPRGNFPPKPEVLYLSCKQYPFFFGMCTVTIRVIPASVDDAPSTVAAPLDTAAATPGTVAAAPSTVAATPGTVAAAPGTVAAPPRKVGRNEESGTPNISGTHELSYVSAINSIVLGTAIANF